MKILMKTVTLIFVLTVFFSVITSEAAERDGSAIAVIYTDGKGCVSTEMAGYEPQTADKINWLVNNVYNRDEEEMALVREYLMLSCGKQGGYRTVTISGNDYIRINNGVFWQKGLELTRLLSGANIRALKGGGFALEAQAPSNAEANIKELTDAYNLAVATKAATSGMTDREKIKYAFENARIGYTPDISTDRPNRCAFTYITSRTGCCETINGMFYLLLRAAGVDADFCLSAPGQHMWCSVNLDGTRYHVDATGVIKNFTTDDSLPEIYRELMF